MDTLHTLSRLAWTSCLLLLAAATAQAQDAHVTPQVDHAERATCVAQDPSRSLIATGSEDHSVRLWKTEADGSCILLQVFGGHGGAVVDVAFNEADSRMLASCARDQTVRVWTVGSQAPFLIRVADLPSSIAFHPDGKLIAVASDRSTIVRFYDPVSGTESGRPLHTTAPVTSVAFSRDGRNLLCGLADGTVEDHTLRTAELVQFYRLSSRPVLKLFTDTGRVVAVSVDGRVGVAVGGDTMAVRTTHLQPRGVSATPSLDTLLIVDGPSQIAIVHVGSDSTERVGTSSKEVDAVVKGNDGSLYIHGEEAGHRYAWWNRPAGSAAITRVTEPYALPTCVALSPTGDFLAVGDSEGTVTIYRLAIGDVPLRYSHLGLHRVNALCFSVEAERLVIGGSGEACLALISTDTWEVEDVKKGERDIVDMKIVGGMYCYILDRTFHQLLLLDLFTPQTLEYIVGSVDHIALSPSTDHLIALDPTQLVLINARTARVEKETRLALQFTPTAVGVFNSARSILLGTPTGSAQILDVASGKVMRELKAIHSGPITDVVASEQTILTAGADAAVRTWDPFTLVPKEPKVFDEHHGRVLGIDIDHRGALIASCSEDGSVIVRRRDSVSLTRNIVQAANDWLTFDHDGTFDASPSGTWNTRVVKGLTTSWLASLAATHYRPFTLSALRHAMPVVETPYPSMNDVVMASMERPLFTATSTMVRGAGSHCNCLAVGRDGSDTAGARSNIVVRDAKGVAEAIRRSSSSAMQTSVTALTGDSASSDRMLHVLRGITTGSTSKDVVHVYYGGPINECPVDSILTLTDTCKGNVNIWIDAYSTGDDAARERDNLARTLSRSAESSSAKAAVVVSVVPLVEDREDKNAEHGLVTKVLMDLLSDADAASEHPTGYEMAMYVTRKVSAGRHRLGLKEYPLIIRY